MKIRNITVNRFWKGEAGIRAVAEDAGKEYKVGLHIKDDEVLDHTCSCRRKEGEKGLCPHEEALREVYRKEYSEKGKSQAGRGPLMVYTSPEVRAMIREYTNREVEQIQLEGQEAQVELIPKLTLVPGGPEVKVSFCLSGKRKMPINDLAAFAQAMVQGSFVEYGKDFAFHHNPDMFKPESRPLAEFAAELANTYREYFSQFRRSAFETQPPLKELALNRENRDRFFTIVEGQALETQIGNKEKGTRLVCCQNPRFRVAVRRQNETGLSVSLKGNYSFFWGERRMYAVDGERIYLCDGECSRTLSVFMDQMNRSRDFKVTVHEKDIPLFYERVVKKIEDYCILEGDEIPWQSYRPEPLKACFRFDSRRPGEVELDPVLSYGDYSFHPAEDETLPRTVCRDVPGEFRISRLIAKYFHLREDGGKEFVIQNDDERMFQFLESGMGEFARLGQVQVSENMGQLKILPRVKVRAKVSMDSGWLDIKVDMDGINGSDFTRILDAYQQKRKFCRLKTGEFLRMDDDGLLAMVRLLTGLSLSGDELLGQGARLPGYRALYLDSLLKEGPGIAFYRDQMFKAVVRGMKAVEDSDFAVPPILQDVLRGYQKTGYRWLKTLDGLGFGGILADDMGLGKTVQIIALFADEYLKEGKEGEDGLPSLIVCPASLVYNWENEFKKFAPAIRVLAVAGNASCRRQALRSLAGGGCQGAWVLITSYELLKRDMEYYREMPFRFQVIDEAQYIKNPSTQAARAVKAVRAKTRFALTGTPVENRLSELWSIFDYLMPGFLFAYSKFKRFYEIPIARDGDGESLSRLRRLAGPFILRRLKKDVLKELPEKLEMEVYSKFEEKQKEIYMANAARLKAELEDNFHPADKLQILAGLTRLRQICCDPGLCYEHYKGGSAKLETCVDLVKNGIQGGHKILLFSQFTSMLSIIAKRLSEEEIRYYRLTGSTPKEERLQMTEDFAHDDVPVFLISLKAGGTGLNLTAADLVIQYDPWWNVAAQNQAADRAHRIGQEKQVTVLKLITKGTVEENMLRLQESKKHLADQVIGEGTVDFASFSREEILEMLGVD